jgi:hypothetical protein
MRAIMRWVTIAIAAVAALSGIEQVEAQAAAEQPSHLTFEVATIKPTEPGVQSGMIKPLPGGDGYTVQNLSVKMMIIVIYRVPGRQIMGGPDWVSSERFDIEAKADRAYGVEELHEMFRNLFFPFQESWGAPYLARFSRDVGYHEP